jgi:C1A family cysteine protease
MHRYGWKVQKPDHRDLKFKLIRRDIQLPQLVDLRPFCSAVENQGNLGSCTANALVGNLEFVELKDKVPYEEKSRLFIYYNERDIEGTTDQDSGAEIRDGIKTLAKDGCCSESEWDYDITQFAVQPPFQCYIDAKQHRITNYYGLETQDEILNCLASGYPVVVGISVYESFESEDVAKTGIVPIPDLNEQLQGGHAVLVVGYDLQKQIYIVRNSWGDTWGDKGYFYLPFEYLNTLGSDFWTIRR